MRREGDGVRGRGGHVDLPRGYSSYKRKRSMEPEWGKMRLPVAIKGTSTHLLLVDGHDGLDGGVHALLLAADDHLVLDDGERRHGDARARALHQALDGAVVRPADERVVQLLDRQPLERQLSLVGEEGMIWWIVEWMV